MKYRSIPVEVEAIQYTGNFTEAHEFCIAHADANLDRTHRPGPLYRTARGSVFLQVWVEKSRAYCYLELGDYIVAESDGRGVYPCHRANFEAKYVEA